MTYDGKLLALARAGLEKDREANLAEHQRRIDEAYHRVPELEQIDLTLRSHMAGRDFYLSEVPGYRLCGR